MMCWAAGSYGAIQGVKNTITSSAAITKRPKRPAGRAAGLGVAREVQSPSGAPELQTNPGIEEPVREVGYEIGADEEECDDEHTPAHDRIVARLDGVEDEAAQAGPREDDFDEDRPAHQRPQA